MQIKIGYRSTVAGKRFTVRTEKIESQ